jgi:hypothetical protein
MRWNPLGRISERLREVLIVDPALTAGDLWIWAAAIAVFALGLWIFRRVAPYFEDFL